MSFDDAIQFLETEVNNLPMSVSSEQLAGFRTYLEALAAYNEKVNLVADAQPLVVAKRHVLDCLAVAHEIRLLLDKTDNRGSSESSARSAPSLIDIGSGAGLPGLIVAIACPDLNVTLLDSIGKKTRFLEDAAKELSIADRVSVVTGRAEQFGRTLARASFDFATSRAVGHLGLVAELTMPLLKIGGRLLCQKSMKQVDLEIAELKQELSGLGGTQPEILVPKVQVSENEHVIVSIEKKFGTQQQYPHEWAEIIRHWKG